MADKVRIQGNQYDFGSTSLKLADEPIYGYVSLSWTEKRERQKGYGAGKSRTPRGKSRGRYTTEPAKLVVWRDTWTEIKKMLAAKSSDGKSYGNVEFPMVLQYVEDESNQDPITVVFYECTIEGASNSTEEEGGNDKVEVTVAYQRVVENDLTLYDSAEDA